MKEWEKKVNLAWEKLRYSSEDNGTFTYGVKAGQFKRIAKELMRYAYVKGLERAAKIAMDWDGESHYCQMEIVEAIEEEAKVRGTEYGTKNR